MIAHPRRCHPMKFHLSPRDRDESGQDFRTSICGWFTEGFDTPDLKEAKALLDEQAGTHQLISREIECPLVAKSRH